MSSWTDLQATGKGEVVYLLEIPGIGVFSTYDYTPTDSWFTSAGYGASRVYDLLKHEDLGPIKEEIDFIEGNLKVGSITARISNINGEMTSLFRSWQGRTFTWLTTNATDTSTTFSAVDTSAFSTTNDLYIGQEVCNIGTIPSSTSFAGLTRGALGTVARPYTVQIDAASGVSEQPVITTAPHVLVGRKCYLHAAAMVDGSPGSTSIIYRGIISKGISVSQEEWTIPIDHISTLFKRKLAQNLPESPLKPGYGISIGERVHFIVINDSTRAFTQCDDFIDPGFYTREELAEEWESVVRNNSPPPQSFPSLTFNGEKYEMRAPAVSGYTVMYQIRENSALHFLGFSPGWVVGDSSTDYEDEAEDPPMLWAWQVPPSPSSTSDIEVENGDVFTTGQWVVVEDNTAVKIDSISSNTISFGGIKDGTISPKGVLKIKDDEDKMVLKHALAFVTEYGNHLTIKQVIQKALFLETGQAEPIEWVISGIVSSDIDFDEYDDAFAYVSPHLNRWSDFVTKGMTLQKLIGPFFGMNGISPRITTDGKIGFTKLVIPNNLDKVSVAVNEEVWDLISAIETETSIGSSPLINQVQIAHSFNYASGGDGKFSPIMKLFWKDGFNQLSANRTIKYEVRGLQLGLTGYPRQRNGAPLGEALADINQSLSVSHYGIFGREIFTAEIPTTWLSKQLKCGDIVSVTHELVEDITEGATGLSSRLGIVVGKTFQTVENKADSLTILFGPVTYPAGIAPCALATSFDSGTVIATFNDCQTPLYEQSGQNDLDRFVRDDVRVEILFVEYDTTNATTWTATIITNGVNTNTKQVRFTTNSNFPTTFPTNGAWMVLPDWTNTQTWMQDYAYIADGDASPDLGASGDPPKIWSI